MCGRYSLIAEIGELAVRFEFDAHGLAQATWYNIAIAPTQMVLAVRSGDPRQASYMRWGLIPSGTRNSPSGAPMINARAETVAERPSFRSALTRRRCLIPADGFYEWRRDSAGKRPVRITLASGEPFAFAGLWRHGRTRTASPSSHAPSSRQRRTSSSSPSTTGCRSSCPENWRRSGWTTTCRMPPPSSASLPPTLPTPWRRTRSPRSSTPPSTTGLSC